ncbi:vesicle-associated membrane protein 5 [Anarhichas minor]|uniref:vesicle-associated membrane protein 5 n=1 Tax=Anarhichas minor TaxID=65739 RepID=UPI003F7400DF
MENGKNRLQQAQEDVEEVKGIMLENMNKADERTEKLGDLEERAEHLMSTAVVFEKRTEKVKQQKRWENKKMKVVFIGIGVAAALIILGLIIYAIVNSTGA